LEDLVAAFFNNQVLHGGFLTHFIHAWDIARSVPAFRKDQINFSKYCFKAIKNKLLKFTEERHAKNPD